MEARDVIPRKERKGMLQRYNKSPFPFFRREIARSPDRLGAARRCDALCGTLYGHHGRVAGAAPSLQPPVLQRNRGRYRWLVVQRLASDAVASRGDGGSSVLAGVRVGQNSPADCLAEMAG